LGFIPVLLFDASSKYLLWFFLSTTAACVNAICQFLVSCCCFFYLFSLGSLYIFANIKLPSDESRASDINSGELLMLSAFLLSPLPLLCYPLLWWGGLGASKTIKPGNKSFKEGLTPSAAPRFFFFLCPKDWI